MVFSTLLLSVDLTAAFDTIDPFIQLLDSFIHLSDHIKLLGVALDCNLNFASHISNRFFLLLISTLKLFAASVATLTLLPPSASPLWQLVLDSTTRMPHFLVFQIEIFDGFSDFTMHLHVLSWPTVHPVHICSFHPSIGCLSNSAYHTNMEHWFTNLFMALHHSTYPDSSLHTHRHASSDHLINIFCPFCAVTLFLNHEVSAIVVHIVGTHFLPACVHLKLTPRSVPILKHLLRELSP